LLGVAIVEIRPLILGECVVGVAVEPAFARLTRGDDGMASRVGVFASVLVRRAIAAEGDAAFLAGPQMHPRRAELHTLVALQPAGPFNRFDRFDMGAFAGGHRKSVMRSVSPGANEVESSKRCGLDNSGDSCVLMPFRALHLSPQILQAVRDAGYTEPTPIQVAAIPPILAGHDLIGIAQTGTGKTAAFVLPILTKLAASMPNSQRRGTRVLVVAPTRELVVQIEENVRAYAKHVPLRMATVFGGVSERPQLEALRSGVDLVVATPGRLIDLMGQRAGNFSGIEFLVLDEADRMLDMGFLPQVRQIVKALPQKRQTLMFSASLSPEIEKLVHEFQRSPKVVEIGRRANPAETVTQFVYEVPSHLKPALLLHLLSDPKFDTVLVFTRTKHGADRIARRLESSGIKTGTIHSNRSQNQRLRALKDFKSGAVRVLVATDIAARGIDVDGISHVVNYDFPMHSEDYVHRIGRTGRALAIGDAISFITPDDHGPLRSLERFIGRGIVRKRAEGFDYNAAGPPRDERGRGQRRHSAPRMEPKSPGNSARGSGDLAQRNSGQRPRAFASTRRSWGRSR
jgi:ATP-dependent RNA helicase RhlE